MPISGAGSVRRPTVAGYYYPAEPAALARAVDAVTVERGPSREARAVIMPHGSYQQAGAIVGSACARVTIPRRCIILSPSHTGSWVRWSLMTDGAYRTPLGEVPVDAACAAALRARCGFLEPDGWGQAGEHAVEVVLPFLQRRGPADLAIVPIVMGCDDPAERAQLATALAQVIRLQEEPVLLVASANLSQYEPAAEGRRKDRALLEAIGTLDAVQLVERIAREEISTCSAGVLACVMDGARKLGAQGAAVAGYGTSAEAGGDPDSVTGYAGIVIE